MVILDSELDVEVSELRIFELFPIIKYQASRDFEPAYYGPPNKVTHLFLDDCCNGSASAHLVK